MKIDMHCHVKEGSIDSKVPIEEYITRLKEKGIDGMLVTDHDTYNGYRYWKRFIKGKEHQDFVVLKGVEYDTRDAGHILIIMPQGVKMKLLELRGLPLSLLIDFVHYHGGICGPAHPCGEKYMSFTNTKLWQKSPELLGKFDFIETFNACESSASNAGARLLAEKYGKAGIGGSDAHKPDCAGLAYTEFPNPIKTELDLIMQIRNKEPILAEGQCYTKTTKDKIGKANKLLVYSFWFYNRGGALLRMHSRKNKIQAEQPIDPIDPIEIPYLKKIKRKH
ncbi:MAG: PHP domain-containing protein [Coprococcus sp.]|nr:PHP domain-containing protein [Coprococcus sp.]